METLTLQTETSRLLDFVVHSLYTKRDIFLRELIANASDALDRLAFERLVNPQVVDAAPLEIHLEADPAARTLTVRDNGIGMSRAEVIDNIGTLARSGTSELIERLRHEGSARLPQFIGRFGVGFYSSFMVADRVTVVTRRAGETHGTRWESRGDIEYTIDQVDDVPQGTAVTLQLKAADPDNGIEDYADRWVLSRIVKQYTDFVTFPIVYHGPVEELDGASTPTGPSDAVRVLNSRKPLWTRPESEVSEQAYVEFYQHVSHEWSEPLLRISAKAEGRWEYAALVFVPSRAPHGIFYQGFSYGLQLYSQRMLVVENCQDLVPRYLRFLKGVVDASDLPLNVSRQSLQDVHQLDQIRRWLTKKVLDSLTKLRETNLETYLMFWKEFGRVLKEGISEDSANGDRLLPLVYFESSADATRCTTLSEYVERMKPGQKDILYLTGESRAIIERSPHLEEVLARGYEVLYLSDPVDELLVQAVSEYESRRLRSVAKGTLDLGEVNEQAAPERQDQAEKLASLLQLMEQHLRASVRAVRVSPRLRTSPACLSGEEYDPSPQLERLLLRGKGAGPRQRRILEVNANHPVISAMRERLLVSSDDSLVKTCADLLYGYAVLAEGSELADPVAFNASLAQLISHALDARN